MPNIQGPPFTVEPDAVVTLRNLSTTSTGDLAFLDGRTLDHSVGLAPTSDPPFTGANWEMHQEGSVNQFSLRCLGLARTQVEEGQNLWLCATSTTSVGLTNDANHWGRIWTIVDDLTFQAENNKQLISVDGMLVRGAPLGPTVDLTDGPDMTFHGTSWQLGPITADGGRPSDGGGGHIAH